MIQIEDSNKEDYFINPKNVVYVKKRSSGKQKELWKISFINGEQLFTKNQSGVQSIIESIKIKR